MKLDFCVACGDDSEIHFHHLVPKSRGGSDSEKNLLALCPACHGLIHSARFKNGHSQLTKDGLARRKAKGLPGPGSAPYGLKREGDSIVPCEQEQATLRLIMELRAKGFHLRLIAKELTRLGLKSRRGLEWNFGVIGRIIKDQKKRPPSVN